MPQAALVGRPAQHPAKKQPIRPIARPTSNPGVLASTNAPIATLATASMIDFVRRFRGPGTDQRDLFLSRVFTAFWGGFACLIALQAGRLGSAIEVVNKFGSYFYGSILGVFMLAVLTRRANGTGASLGLFAGMAMVGIVATTTTVHFLWWNLVGAMTVFVVGYVISRAVPSKASSPW